MEKVKEYMVVSAIDQIKIANTIKEQIEKGWEPIGGISISWGKVNTLPGTLNDKIVDGFLFAQAMVKY